MRGLLVGGLLFAGCGRLGFGPVGEPTDAAPIAGLVARYSMEDDPSDGTIEDTSGNGHTAHCIVGASCPTSVPGKRGNSLQFDGSQFLRVTDHPSFHNARAFTLAAWVFLDTDIDIHVAVGKAFSSGVDNSFNLFHVDDSSCIEWFQDIAGDRCTAPGGTLAGRWTHWMEIWDGSEIMLYVDGVRAFAQGLAGDVVYDDHDVIIGADDDVGAIQVFWLGRIDEVHIFDRALEPAEIAELSKP